jgi:hypothetical protein
LICGGAVTQLIRSKDMRRDGLSVVAQSFMLTSHWQLAQLDDARFFFISFFLLNKKSGAISQHSPRSRSSACPMSGLGKAASDGPVLAPQREHR